MEGERDQPRLRLRILLAPSPTKDGINASRTPPRLRRGVHLPTGIAAHTIPGRHGPRTPPRLRRSGIHIPPGMATQVKAGMKTGGKAAEKATRHQMPSVITFWTSNRQRRKTMGKRMSTNVEYRCQPNGGMFPIQIGGMTTELTKLSTTGQRASTATQPGAHHTHGNYALP